MTITNRLRLRPAVPREIIPTTAPMIASGMISQLAQPSSGMKAMSAKISATAPMMSEIRLNIGRLLTSFRRLRQARRSNEGCDVQGERGPDRGERDRMGTGERLAIQQDG